jgi:hypothetical protein
MSMSLSLYIVEPEKDKMQWIGQPSNVLHDLFYGLTGGTLECLLSNDEFNVLQPTSEAKDARSLSTAIARVAAILLENEDRFPRAHWVVCDDLEMSERMDSSAYWQDESGRQWMLDGFHHSMEHREEIEVRVHVPNAPTEFHWIPAKGLVEVGGRSFKIHSQSWYELCYPDIDGALKICDQAIRMNAPVIWRIS